ncbi:MAG: hypothetical protein OEZ68_06620 [Gammaproteobacteria bacterium]|nr:hypothetical protein [Gammaproteobacteria bacterium]MDH5800464.1 hypothetical protein [Gammaproteobacteria bacterium]
MFSKDNSKKTNGFGVAPSPFNAVKLELGVILVLSLCVWLAAEFITANDFVQLLILSGFSVAATVWLILRTKVLLSKGLLTKENHKKDPDSGSESN